MNQKPIPISADPSFRMTVEDVFTIRGRGTVVTGRVESGTLNVGDEIHIKRQSSSKKTVVTGIEAFRKQLNQAHSGDNVGVLLRDVGKQEVQRGDVLMGSDSEFRWAGVIELTDSEMEAVRSGRVIEAIKLVGARTGAGLKECQDAVEEYQRQIAAEMPREAMVQSQPAAREHFLKRLAEAFGLSLFAVVFFLLAWLSLKAFFTPIPGEADLELIQGTIAKRWTDFVRPLQRRPPSLLDLVLIFGLWYPVDLMVRVEGRPEQLKYDDTLPCYRSVYKALEPGSHIEAWVKRVGPKSADIWQLQKDGRVVLSYKRRRASERIEIFWLVVGLWLTVCGIYVLGRIVRGVWLPRLAMTALAGLLFIGLIWFFDAWVRPLIFKFGSCP